MEGLFNERLQVRTRHLEERVSALTKQLAVHKEDNIRLHTSQADATQKVQLLEEDLKSERDRCHKLLVSLSSCRQNLKKKTANFNKELELNDADHDQFDEETMIRPPAENRIGYYSCPHCAGIPPTLRRSEPHDRDFQMLPNYMGIMPARLNTKLMKAKKMNKPALKYQSTKVMRSSSSTFNTTPGDHHHSFGSAQAPDCLSCPSCCHKLEIFLAHRLHLNEHQHTRTDPDPKSRALKKPIPNRFGSPKASSPIMNLHHPLASSSITCCVPHITGGEQNQSMPAPHQSVHNDGKWYADTLVGASINAKRADGDLQALATLSREGFYVKMEPTQDFPQVDNVDNVGYSSFEYKEDDGRDLQSTQYIKALRAENEALRSVLLSMKKIEIQELESELRDIKQSASFSMPLSAFNPRTSSASNEVAGKDGHAIMAMDDTDREHINRLSQLDPVKYLDTLHSVEDKILKKKMAILGLEGVSGGAACGNGELGPYLGEMVNAKTDTNHIQGVLNEDMRQLLKALARDVVVLRHENDWLKQKCHDVTHAS